MSKSTLPPSATPLEYAVETHMEEKFGDLPIHILSDLHNPEKIPDHLLPYLAAHLSADVWNPLWSAKTKRNVIKNLIKLHQNKGTLGAIHTALDGLDMACRVLEWPNYNGDPYKFKVDVSVQSGGMDKAAREELYMTIAQAKNLRSWLDSVRVFLSNSKPIQVGVAMITGHKIRIYQKFPRLPNMIYQAPTIAIAAHISKKIRIYQEVAGLTDMTYQAPVIAVAAYISKKIKIKMEAV